jgi:hypothetical protein
LSNKSVPSYHSVDPSTDPKDSPWNFIVLSVNKYENVWFRL